MEKCYLKNPPTHPRREGNEPPIPHPQESSSRNRPPHLDPLPFAWTVLDFSAIISSLEVTTMAKVLDPQGSTEARGRIGGRVFNTWRGINYVKTSTAPAQPRSQLQLRIRAFCTRLVRLWQTLDAAHQGYWNDYAQSHTESGSMGVGKRLTGANWYVRCNVRLLCLGLAVTDVPPAVAAPQPVEGLTCTGGALQVSIDWTQAGGTDLALIIYLQGPHSPGQKGKIERARFKSDYAGEAVGPVVITSLGPGTYTCFARYHSEVNGLASTWVSKTFVVTPV